MTDAGPLRHRIRIETPTETRDATGGVTLVWTEKARRWASIRPLNGVELIQARAVHADVTHRVLIRHLPGMTPKDRIVFGSRVFDVQSAVDPVGVGELHDVLATERIL